MELKLESFISAYRNISFNPEKRGQHDFDYYNDLLSSDLESLGDNQGNYKEKFVSKLMTYYSRLSRVASTMITGPANFPVRQNMKANESANKAYDDFNHWREKYFKAVNRVRTLSPEEEIDKTLSELDRLIEKKETMKENGCKSYEMTSITNKIRERKKKLEVMRVRIERKESFEPIPILGGVIDIVNDKLIVKHDEKPEQDVISIIKESGFRWSPYNEHWTRKHTGNAIYKMRQMIERLNEINKGVVRE